MMIDFDSIDGIKDIICLHQNHNFQLEQHQPVEQINTTPDRSILRSSSWPSPPHPKQDQPLPKTDTVPSDNQSSLTPTSTLSSTLKTIDVANSHTASNNNTVAICSCEKRIVDDKSMSPLSPQGSSPSLPSPRPPCMSSPSTVIKSTPTSILTNVATNETDSIAPGKNYDLISCLLITANVGTIFEESTLLELWFQQLRDYLIKIKPKLVAIHCQEVGGKNFESSMKNVSIFTGKILGDQDIISDYSRVRIFLDDNFEFLDKFTALGSLYLIHDSVQNIKLYNFRTAQYDLIQNRVIHKDKNVDFKYDKSKVDEGNLNSEPEAKIEINCDQASSRSVKQNNESNNNHIETRKETETLVLTGPCDHVEKAKFPGELFPECRWSRKGFMRTRWMFNDKQSLDLVNIHLFHDASNLIAMETTPSPYAKNRRKALEFALKKLSTPLPGQTQDEVPLFIFGDFNFRLDTNKVIQRITEGVSPSIRTNDYSGEPVKLIYRRKLSGPLQQDSAPNNNDTSAEMKSSIPIVADQELDNSNVVMTIGKKLFDCQNLDEIFRANKNTEWLLEFDNELKSFKDQLYEFKISFSPSYPFKEDKSGGHSYMKTRCPAWCDRILFNSAGNRMIFSRNQEIAGSLDSEKRIESLQSQGDVIYRLMGNSVPMGDHKPVLLYCQLDLSTPG